MIKSTIQIPEGVFYLGNYPQILNLLPSGKFIFNKVMTGCGATTLFLDDTVPTVLCSPRKELLHCKAYSNRFQGRVHLFGDIGSEKVFEKINAVKDYIYTCGYSPFFPVSKVPKILVTYDSAKYVIQTLFEMGILEHFRFVADEFQTLFTDAAYRGDTEAEFMQNLNYASSVIFMSATPYLENYLEQVDDFNNLLYVELQWPQSSLHPTNIVPMMYLHGSPDKTMKAIIEQYVTYGFFEESMDYYGNPVRAREAVFFVNDVRFIIRTIQKNNLSPSEVNVICSERDENKRALKKVNLKIGHAPIEGERHAPYTFVTKASYEGTDFYSPSAYTYIFSNINRENLALDISLDLPQIMGRQRLDSNPFRYSATLFYKTKPDFSDAEKYAFMEKIKAKEKVTNDFLNDYLSMDDNARNRYAAKFRAAQEAQRYEDDYLTVVDDRKTNKPVCVFNKYVLVNELRAWDVQMNQYQGITYVMGSVNNAFTGNTTVSHQKVMQFQASFSGIFEQKMRMYSEFLDSNPDCMEELQQSVCIPNNIKEFYNSLGSGRLRALSWKKSSIEAYISSSKVSMDDSIREAFSGSWYSLSDIKTKLQEIYDRHGLKRTAKANDITKYLSCTPSKRTDESGIRQNGYSILR